MKKSLLVLFMLAAALANSAYAARDTDAPPADCEGLSVATGPMGKGYSVQFADLKKVTKGAIPICEVNTEGGLDNLTTLSTKGADVGIVPIDALKQMAAGNDAIKSLLVVATLNSNYLHIITKASGVTYAGKEKYFGLSKEAATQVRITSFSQLRGQPVAAVGSAQLLVYQLNKQLGMNMNVVDKASDKEAFAAVKSGQVLAVFTVAGWPHGAIKDLHQDSDLTMVPFDGTINAPYTVKPLTYKGLGAYNVNSLAVQNVLVTRAFSGSDKIQEVANLKRTIAANLSALKDGKFSPGWNEIGSLDAQVDWPRFMATAGSSAKHK